MFKVQQFGIDILFGLTQYSNQLTSVLSVLVSEERVCGAFLRRPRCTTNTMDVVLGTVWVVKVDDKLHVIHIYKINATVLLAPPNIKHQQILKKY